MRFSLSLSGDHNQQLLGATTNRPGLEGCAFLLCGLSRIDTEVRLLSREVLEIQDNEYLVREPLRLSVSSTAYARAAKRAASIGASVVFVHSHPCGIPDFSAQDDREEPKLMEFLVSRDVPGVQGSLLFAGAERKARAWHSNGWAPMDRIRIIGARIGYFDSVAQEEVLDPFYDRQVRAFGADIQRLLARLHVGIVGAGGTGSAVGEQLTRLGVGTISIFDGDTFEKSNVSRVYGSRVEQDGEYKAEMLTAHLRDIGLGTRIQVFNDYITTEDVARKLRACDVIFGCTDNHTSRGILNELSGHYLIPLFDTAVKIESKDGIINEVYGRVTTVLPSEACLYCRKRVDPDMMRLESMPQKDRRSLADERYAPELETNAPAVIAFTSMVAAQAVSEFLHRLTGFMGAERLSTETLLFLASGELRRNRTPATTDCLCSKPHRIGRGDTNRAFLGMSWAK